MSSMDSVHTPAKRPMLLFTPGPLTTTPSVRKCMQEDFGSRDAEFCRIAQEVHDGLLDIAGVSYDTHASILLPGSGTYSVEAVISSCTPRSIEVLVLINGAYGKRARDIASILGIPVKTLEWPEDKPIDVEETRKFLESEEGKRIGLIMVAHVETTSGVLNPIDDLAKMVDGFRSSKSTAPAYASSSSPSAMYPLLLVDSMSGFAGAPRLPKQLKGIDFLVSSSNKCLQGTPGLSFVIGRRAALDACTSSAPRSLSLDLISHFKFQEENKGQFRFTPPVQVVAALNQAIKETKAEGLENRLARYAENMRVAVDGLAKLGIKCYVEPANRAPICTSFLCPSSEDESSSSASSSRKRKAQDLQSNKWNFEVFYQELRKRGFQIYPGKLTSVPCFRIGHIGEIYPSDTQQLVDSIEEVLTAMASAKPKSQ